MKDKKEKILINNYHFYNPVFVFCPDGYNKNWEIKFPGSFWKTIAPCLEILYEIWISWTKEHSTRQCINVHMILFVLSKDFERVNDIHNAFIPTLDDLKESNNILRSLLEKE